MQQQFGGQFQTQDDLMRALSEANDRYNVRIREQVGMMSELNVTEQETE